MNLEQSTSEIFYNNDTVLAMTDFQVYEEKKLFTAHLTLMKGSLVLDIGEGEEESELFIIQRD